MLKSRGLSMDPWGTPYSKSVQVLYVPFTIMWYIVVYIFREREVFWGNYVSNTIRNLKKPFLVSLVRHGVTRMKMTDESPCQTAQKTAKENCRCGADFLTSIGKSRYYGECVGKNMCYRVDHCCIVVESNSDNWQQECGFKMDCKFSNLTELNRKKYNLEVFLSLRDRTDQKRRHYCREIKANID